MTTDLANYTVEIRDQVARITLIHHARGRALAAGKMPADPHWELYEIFNKLRVDNGVRVVVLAGERDGVFMVPEPFPADTGDDGHFDQPSSETWKTSTAIVRMHEAMAELDRPIIAKVNGDAIGLGASIVFAADLIVAREDARIADNHLGMGEVEPNLGPIGVLPGDGGTALMPLFMSPTRAKEYLMLAREDVASDLARLGVINYAVPHDALDALVEDLVARLLRRPAYALAWTKRVANKHVVDQLHRTLDAGIAYELVNLAQLGQNGSDDLRLD